jgi:fructokinase
MILVCGEALIDFVPRAFDGQVAYVPVPGGSPYNVAIGLGRLELPVGFLGRCSTDAFGRRLRAHLAASGVDLAFCGSGPEASTLAVVVLEPGREPEFAFYGDRAADVMLALDDLPAELPETATALHFGSISLVREPGATTFEALMRRERGRRVLSLDPNVRPGLIPDREAYVRRLEGWVGLVDLVKVSRADLAWLYPGTDPESAARRWLDVGPGLVVVTLGADGAFGICGSLRREVRGQVVTVADTVGAGDAFTSGLLGWLESNGRLTHERLRGLTAAELDAALGQGILTAAITCTRTGAEPPTRTELAAGLEGSGGAGRSDVEGAA